MSFFKDVIGQEDVKQLLIHSAKNGKMPHAVLLTGPAGSGKLPIALAVARYLLCHHPAENDACGQCNSCKIYVRESDEIQRKLSLKASQGGYKVMLIWLPEKMNVECANKLLKLLEEPPLKTVFLLVSEEPDLLLPTIVSRTQRINLKPLPESDIERYLVERYMLPVEDARDIAHRSAGSLLRAVENVHLGEENKLCFELFVNLMRTAYKRDIRSLKAWSEQVAGMGRERQKNLLEYCQRMVRENFICNFRQPDMVYLNPEELQFASRFAPYINERNIISVMELLGEAQVHIEQNVNPKMVFFDMALRMIVEMKQQ